MLLSCDATHANNQLKMSPRNAVFHHHSPSLPDPCRQKFAICIATFEPAVGTVATVATKATVFTCLF